MKKSWNILDEQLKDREIVAEDELLRVMNRKKSHVIDTLNRINRNNKYILLTTSLLLVAVVFTKTCYADFLNETLFWAIIAAIPPAVAWSIYSMCYLAKTRIDEMPLATVIERVNKYNYRLTIEHITGSVILLLFILISITSLGIWERNFTDQAIILFIWLSAVVFYFWFANKYIFGRLKAIRKNLEELKELKEGE